MLLTEMIGKHRELSRDNEQPYLWSGCVIQARLHEGQRQAAIRRRLIRDRSTLSVCDLSFSLGVFEKKLHTSIINIEHLSLYIDDAFHSNLRIVDVGTLNHLDPEWRESTGTPAYAVNEDNTIILSPTPSVLCKVKMEVIRYPLGPDTAEMEVSSEHHENIVHFALSMAHLDADSDAYSPSKAKRFLDMFEAQYGQAVGAGARRRSKASAPHRNRIQL